MSTLEVVASRCVFGHSIFELPSHPRDPWGALGTLGVHHAVARPLEPARIERRDVTVECFGLSCAVGKILGECFDLFAHYMFLLLLKSIYTNSKIATAVSNNIYIYIYIYIQIVKQNRTIVRRTTGHFRTAHAELPRANSAFADEAISLLQVHARRSNQMQSLTVTSYTGSGHLLLPSGFCGSETCAHHRCLNCFPDRFNEVHAEFLHCLAFAAASSCDELDAHQNTDEINVQRHVRGVQNSTSAYAHAHTLVCTHTHTYARTHTLARTRIHTRVRLRCVLRCVASRVRARRRVRWCCVCVRQRLR